MEVLREMNEDYNDIVNSEKCKIKHFMYYEKNIYINSTIKDRKKCFPFISLHKSSRFFASYLYKFKSIYKWKIIVNE